MGREHKEMKEHLGYDIRFYFYSLKQVPNHRYHLQ